ncbi:MAG: sugar phosphate isomerase/epimerase [Kiritimatiellae bacterium]|nr:sugar phosphate isomerase/epimerase [Kiritimatiellia bacterium]
MKRREFLTGTAAAGVVAACMPAVARAEGGSVMPKLAPPPKPAKLNLSLQWGTIPGKEINEKLDYMEQSGYQAFEIPTGDWLLKNGEALKKAMAGRKLFIATACGPSNFSYGEPEKREAEVQKFLPQLEVLGMLGAVGLILCPARGYKQMGLGFKELRDDFVGNTGKRLAEKAAQCGTAIVLEPLCHQETPFLKQVADGAAMCRDMESPGAKVMGDFWHMNREETSFFGALMSGGKYLVHIHIASLRNRRVPGTDGDADNYVDGFKALKLLGYQGAVSFEGGFPKDGNREELLGRMKQLLREQWEQA